MQKLIIQSTDNSDERYDIEAENAISLVIQTLEIFRTGNLADDSIAVADLLETISTAIRNHENGEPPFAKHWDFSSPEEAYIVIYFEDSEDDDGTLINTVAN